MQQAEQDGHREARDQLARRTFEISVVALLATGLFVLLWYIGDAFLIIFAGIVFAALLDAMVTALGRVAALPRGLRFAIVLVLFALVGGTFLSTWGLLAVQQMTDFFSTISHQLEHWRTTLVGAGFGWLVGNPGTGLAPMLPNPSGLLTSATTAMTSIFGLVGSAILIVMLGVFLGYDPGSYRNGFLRLLPMDMRARMGEVLDEVGGTLRWWLVGIAINMCVIAVFTTIGLLIIGLPHAIMLGVQAGMLAFIPTIGPVLAAVPIILVSLTVSYTTVFWALGLYLAVQTLESYVLTPVVQMEVVWLSPGTILIVQLIMSALFGAAGLALATPLAAVGKVLVHRLYVEDWLGDRSGPG